MTDQEKIDLVNYVFDVGRNNCILTGYSGSCKNPLYLAYMNYISPEGCVIICDYHLNGRSDVFKRFTLID